MDVSWIDIKQFVDARQIPIQWIRVGNKYYLEIYDGNFCLKTSIFISDPINDDQLDFETNYKDQGNRSPAALVTTQFELNNKVLKLFSATEAYDITDTCILNIKVPQTFTGLDPIANNGRYVAGGYAFSDGYKFGDKVSKIEVVDDDNILGFGAGTVIKSYTDNDAEASNSGWYFWATINGEGEIEIDPIGGYGFLPSGLYLRVTCNRVSGSPANNVNINIWWGKIE